MASKALIIIMGASGSGKTTIGQALHHEIGGHFVEADDFHSAANIKKMSSGTPLNDEDRQSWVKAIVEHINGRSESTITLACSALTPYVQAELKRAQDRQLVWLYLETDKSLLQERMSTRQHFMPQSLIDSQIKALTPPVEAIKLDGSLPVRELVNQCKASMGRKPIGQ
ncbi:MAG: gluconokinase, GntK/IdnK-type [Pseudomonadota bacterium]